jgi:purine-binding chemotaxis protein CheW
VTVPVAGPTACGVLSLDGMQLALPLTVLREVIPAPAALTRLPAVAAGLLGAVELRDRVIPVLDLGPALGLPAAQGRGQVIAVTVHDGQVLGLLAEEVRGITTVLPNLLQRIATQDGTLLFSHAFERSEDGSICSLLDVSQLFRVPGMPTLREGGAAAPDASSSGGSPTEPGAVPATGSVATRGRPVLMVRCGGFQLGLDAVDVHTVLPDVRLQPSPVQGGPCRGVTMHGALAVPAVDLLAVLGLGSLPDGEGGQGVLLRFEQGLIAVMLSEVIDIVTVQDEQVLPVPPLAVRRPEFFRGLISQPGGRQHLLLDAARLLVEPDLVGLSGCNTGPGTGRDGNPRGRSAGSSTAGAGEADLAEDGYARGGRSYLTYSVGADVATPLEQIMEILPFPLDRAVVGTGQGPVMGMIVHRQEALPVVDLAALLGRPAVADPMSSPVLVVGVGGLRVGYLVQDLRAIERSAWEEARDGSAPRRSDSGGLGSRPRLQIDGPGHGGRMIAYLDLEAMAREVFGLPDRSIEDPSIDDGTLDGPSPGGRTGQRPKALPLDVPHQGQRSPAVVVGPA